MPSDLLWGVCMASIVLAVLGVAAMYVLIMAVDHLFPGKREVYYDDERWWIH